jgi:hypothetical protein
MSVRVVGGIAQQFATSDLVAFEAWLSSINRTPVTGWRWRKRGLIHTINILGRLYVSRQAIAEFERRAAAGEFSQIHKTLKKNGDAYE